MQQANHETSSKENDAGESTARRHAIEKDDDAKEKKVIVVLPGRTE